uniref:Ig-like domain-containing protein n=1 Tax=Lynx canadensis TaxID=61383 RepID=A0A667GFM9_LYNCA
MAQKVTQTQPEMSVHEAETVTLDCTFDTRVSNYYLFWYKQPPSGEMVLIIRQEANKQENATNNRFSVNFQKADKSFSLRISAAQLGDAAMYLCALMEGTVTQTQPEMSVHEAETVTLDCTFDTSDSNYYLFWYKQPPSREMVLIIRQEAYKQKNATNNRFSVNFQKADKSFSLRISAAQLEDAAMYLDYMVYRK